MNQQINLYQGRLRRERPAFSAVAMAASVIVLVVALAFASYGTKRHVSSLNAELESIQLQEAAAASRLEHLTRTLAARNGDESATGTLQAALKALTHRERLLKVIDGQGMGETAGFSLPLRALAERKLGGLWLTRILVSAPGMRTTLEGRARSPSLVPEYLLGLAEDSVLAGQRFDRFEIQESDDEGDAIVHFSMTSKLAEKFAQRETTP